MKRKVSLLLTLFFCAAVALFAQHPGQSFGQPMSSLYVESVGQPFWLFVDNVQQNSLPVNSLLVENVPVGEHYFSVVMDNQDQTTIGRFAQVGRMATAFRLENQRHLFGFTPIHGAFHPGMTVSLVHYAPVNAVPPATHNVLPPQGQNVMPVAPPATPIQLPVPEPVLQPAWMSEVDFTKALHLIQDEKFESNRLELAKQVTGQNMLSVNQVISICKTFSYETDKLEYAKFAYHHCVEKDKYYLVNAVFTYSSSKSELNSYVSSQQ